MSEGRSTIRRFGPLLGAAVLVIAAVIVVLAVTGGDDDDDGGIVSAPAFSAEELAATPEENWITNAGDLNNQVYSALDEINTENVGDLEEAWHTDLKSGFRGNEEYAGEANPLVYEGTMYMVTGASDVFAMDAANGEILWKYTANIPKRLDTACCGWNNRGVAIGDGLVYLQRLDGKVTALDQETGEVVWEVTNLRWEDGYAPTSAPRYYDGLVYVGSAGGEYGARGSITAYDAETGERAWRFYTVPEPGAIGSATWTRGPGGFGYDRGGASVWTTPSVDPETNTLFFTTSNAAPWNLRGPGDNLFTSSIVALDTRTGQYRWHYQIVRHDIWDYDCPAPTVQFEMEVDGEMRRALAEPCKTGWMYILDRDTGRPLLPIEDVEVPQSDFQNTAETQPEPVGDRLSNRCARKSTFQGKEAPDGKQYKVGCLWDVFDDSQFVAVAPGANGAKNWHPYAYSPQTNYTYICVNNNANSYKSVDELSFEIGETFIGQEFGDSDAYKGGLVALDMSSNRIAWEADWQGLCYTGTMATAGGVVFAGTVDNKFRALDAETGDQLWESELDAHANASATSYEVDGEQYVAIYAGGEDGETFTERGSKHGDDVYAFKLP